MTLLLQPYCNVSGIVGRGRNKLEWIMSLLAKTMIVTGGGLWPVALAQRLRAWPPNKGYRVCIVYRNNALAAHAVVDDIDTFTIGLAREVAAEGIRVNAVRPGFIYTDMHTSGGEPNRIDRVKELVPMKRGGTVDEVANAIMWLLSDQASYTTGTFIDVSGGK